MALNGELDDSPGTLAAHLRPDDARAIVNLDIMQVHLPLHRDLMDSPRARTPHPMTDRISPHRLDPIGREHLGQIQPRPTSTEEPPVLLSDRRRREPLVIPLTSTTPEPLTQLLIRREVAQPRSKLIHITDRNDIAAAAVLDRLTRTEIKIIGDRRAPLIHRLQERIRKPLRQRRHQHNVRRRIHIMLRTEPRNAHTIRQTQILDQLIDRNEVRIQGTNIPPQSQPHRIVPNPRQGLHRIELILAMLKRSGQSDVHALMGIPLHLPRALARVVRDEDHVLLGKGRHELLPQTSGNSLQPINHAPRRHQRLPQLSMMTIIAMDLENSPRTTLIGP